MPYEYEFLELPKLVTAVPADVEERTVIFLDCGNVDRNPVTELKNARKILNIDHHHDNTRFGTVDHVPVPSEKTASWSSCGKTRCSPSGVSIQELDGK